MEQWNSPPSSAPPCLSTIAASMPTSGDIGAGTYEVFDYKYDEASKTGILKVDGRLDSSSTRIEVKVDITQASLQGTPFPGTYAQTGADLGNADILGSGGTSSANVVCAECSVPSGECTASGPTQAGKESAVGLLEQGQVEGEIFTKSVDMPPVPTAPSGSSDLGNVNSEQTITAGNHTVGSITLNGNETLTIDSSGGPVNLYISGDINISGNASIEHGGGAHDFRIYGKPDDGDGETDQTFTISGGSSAVNTFIYAPDATVEINGGASTPDLRGAVWAKQWDGSSSNNAELRCLTILEKI